MSRLDDALEQMIDAILDSPEYREYDKQRKKVNQYPELKAEIDEFRGRYFVLQSSSENAFDKIEDFEREYSDFMENTMATDFLWAELAFCRMMQDLNLRLTEAIHFE